MAFDLLRLYGVESDRTAVAGAPGEPGPAGAGRHRLEPFPRSIPTARPCWRPPGSRAWKGWWPSGARPPTSPAGAAGTGSRPLNRNQQACLVGGWRQQTGTSAQRIGALLVGVPATARRAVALSPAGSAAASPRRPSRSCAGCWHRWPGRRRRSPTRCRAVDAAGAVWCEPRVVVEVRHLPDRVRPAAPAGASAACVPDVDPAEVRR